jgi:Kdo2-lipid IVA lauroyltransferase/acyltransferase
VTGQLLRGLLDRLVYFLVRIFVCIIQAMPVETCAGLTRVLATLCVRVAKIRAGVIEDNLRHAFPEMSDAQRRELTWRMWEHFFLMIVEIVHAPRKIHDTNWRKYVKLYNAGDIIRAFFDDRPTIVICGHYGNFELSGFVLGILGFPSYTIARRLDNPYLDRFLNEFRGKTGQFILPKNGSSQKIQDVLDRGGTLALLGDQYAGPKGCWVEFFGRPASSHKAIALFTLSNDAPAVFCFARRDGRPLHQFMGTYGTLDPCTAPKEMLNVRAITQWYTRHLEHTIRVAPEQYWWLHRRWKDSPGKKEIVPRRNEAA